VVLESAADLEREEDARRAVEATHGGVVHKLPIDYYVDWVCIDGQTLRWWGEFKYRTYKYGRYKTVVLSCNKYMRLRQMGAAYGVSAYLFISFSGDLRCADVSLLKACDVRWGGRTNDTRRVEDIEPVVLLPMHLFKKVGLYG